MAQSGVTSIYRVKAMKGNDKGDRTNADEVTIP